MNKLFVFILFTTILFNSNAQDDTSAVRTMTEDFFQYLRSSDSSGMISILHPDLQLGTTFTNRLGEPSFLLESKEDLMRAVTAPKKEVWNEVIYDLRIQIDDNLANVWMDYSFFLDDMFSHCGVNSFTFVKTTEGWKIISIFDTRRKEPCEKLKP